MSNKKIVIHDLVNKSILMSPEDGQVIFKNIKKELDNNNHVNISFKNLEVVTSSFLNVAIGKLYGKYSAHKLRNSLTVSSIKSIDKAIVQRVVNTAKIYFKEQKQTASHKKALA